MIRPVASGTSFTLANHNDTDVSESRTHSTLNILPSDHRRATFRSQKPWGFPDIPSSNVCIVYDSDTKNRNTMRLKHLEAALSSIAREFPSPKLALEQYPTSAHLVASVVKLAVDNGDLGEDKICLDLGCGTGMLTVGAAFVSSLVISVDCDEEAIAIAQDNVGSVDLSDSVIFLQARVTTRASQTKKTKTSGNGERSGRGRGGRRSGRGRGTGASQAGVDTKSIIILDGSDGLPFRDGIVDTVLTNPPFGTKHNAGIDVQVSPTGTDSDVVLEAGFPIVFFIFILPVVP